MSEVHITKVAYKAFCTMSHIDRDELAAWAECRARVHDVSRCRLAAILVQDVYGGRKLDAREQWRIDVVAGVDDE